VETDIVGDKIGRIHLGRQDLSELQTRKMKGLKRGRDTDVDKEEEEDEDVISVDDGDSNSDGGVEVKRPRLA
jgi:ribosome production factor 2